MPDRPQPGEHDLCRGIGRSHLAHRFHAEDVEAAFQGIAEDTGQHVRPNFGARQRAMREYLAQRGLDSPAMSSGKWNGSFLAVIGMDDPFVVPIDWVAGGAADVTHRAVDAFERPIGERGIRSAAVRLFIVAEKIGMDHLDAAFDIEQNPETDHLPQHDADEHTRGNEGEFLEESLALIEALEHIDKGQAELQQRQPGHAQNLRRVDDGEDQAFPQAQALYESIRREILRAIARVISSASVNIWIRVAAL